MGVIRVDPDTEGSDENIIINTEDVCVDKECHTPTHKKISKKSTSTKPLDFTKNSGRKALGSRNGRRFENLKYLLSLVENEEFGELDISDFVEPTVSAFAELLSEQGKMAAWDDFINHSEDEQTTFLETSSYSNKDSTLQQETQNVEDQTDCDLRNVHPAFTAEERFFRIDAKLQSFLRRKHLPVGILLHLEEEVTSVFSDDPTSVFISKLANSFERLLLHALCQYLNLKSHSYDFKGSRHTQVESRYSYFNPPSVKLTQFLGANS